MPLKRNDWGMPSSLLNGVYSFVNTNVSDSSVLLLFWHYFVEYDDKYGILLLLTS